MFIIDISHYQGNIDWNLARKVLDFVIMRASIGQKNDEKYQEYAKKCEIPFGVYHYLKAGNREETVAEANYFYNIATANGLAPKFFCADIEYSSQTATNVKEISEVFADTLRARGVKKIGLYIGQSLYPYANKEKYDFIWIPRYGKNTGEADENYAPKYPCDLWQYASVGRIPGIPERVDLNKLYGNKDVKWFIGEEENNMSEKFTSPHFVEFVKGFVGQPYWYGTCVYQCNTALLQRKTQQYPDHYTADRMNKYKANINNNLLCSDCVGLIKGYFWTNGGEGVLESIGKPVAQFKNVYLSNNMPDKSANGMFDYAKSLGLDWGTMDTMPEIPGLAVRMDHHVGVYIGNGEVVEERGFAYGCVKTKLKDRKWLNWYKIPNLKYVENDTDNKVEDINIELLGAKLLKEGARGSNVAELQKALNLVMNADLVIDGDFGPATKEAVKKFQEQQHLTVDGDYGPITNKAMVEVLKNIKKPVEPVPVPQPSSKILVTTANVNIRTGDSTDYNIIQAVTGGTILEPVLGKDEKPLISANGWYAVKQEGQIGWVSGKYV